MAWPIPEIPEKKTDPEPKYGLWMIILILLIVLGVIFSVEIWNVESYIKIIFYGILPGALIWLCFFGVMLNRYEQSLKASQSWKLETERTKDEWRKWSRRQLAVVGNVLYSPEEKGMEVLLGELDNVPAFPKKARPLFNSSQTFPALMSEIDTKLELQCPGYRHFLHSIYVLQTPEKINENRNAAIFQQWDLIPTSGDFKEILESFYDANIFDGLILMLCLQDWPAQRIEEASEFISAQLIASPTFARQYSLPVLSGITRLMPLEKGQLNNELKMLFEYIQPDKENLEYIWLVGTTEKTAVEIMQYATRNTLPLPEKRPLHSIDLSFGPPGEMALPLSFAMLTEAASKTDKDQLLVYQTLQQTGTLCWISRKLYS